MNIYDVFYSLIWILQVSCLKNVLPVLPEGLQISTGEATRGTRPSHEGSAADAATVSLAGQAESWYIVQSVILKYPPQYRSIYIDPYRSIKIHTYIYIMDPCTIIY